MSPSPAKRKRTEDAIMKNSNFWFRDGSIVLQAANTQFRVHWSVLARHSSVFRDMQELPQPSDEPTVDGCPVIHLSDDPTDMEYILNMLYNPAFLAQKTLPLAAIGALIRLGRKYDFEELVQLAAARITSETPTTLKEYDTFEPDYQAIVYYPGLEFDIVTLASENNLLSILPFTYYDIVRANSLVRLFKRIGKRDGTMAAWPLTHLRRCVIARERLLLKQFELGYTLGWARKWEFDDECTDPSSCRKSRETITWDYRSFIASLIPLPFLAQFKLCTACRKHATEAMAAGREKMWQELPQIFDLPPWDQLKNDL
ncbi:BTB domain-containing protein [Mycena sanguinolenta]|uniref:BTB domain-containing protein n=1 Tax=Mycena sanguinolenta TaxID=230812 RepID=A0A8H6Z4W9_9AGAR|nr:BTB domain-containing protein [Mycena sanguinolenta]